MKYVSRGALKIEGVLKNIVLDVKDKVVLDVGASHGGFVQVMLLKGAKKVYAVDVGYGLLDWKLRNDDKVVVMERFNAKNLTRELFEEQPEIGLIDVSFISLKKVLPIVFNIVTEKVVALVKPQFEATYKEASKGKGIIEDTQIHMRVIEEIKEVVENPNWKYIGLYPSDVKGRKGNQEYFIYYERV
jgi:23S rRNA (cytidine1920-2'-O)/16S rRNA (cytidine1409-2'-O)-methyltransferase